MDKLYLNFFGPQKYLKDTVLFSYQHQPQQQKTLKPSAAQEFLLRGAL